MFVIQLEESRRRPGNATTNFKQSNVCLTFTQFHAFVKNILVVEDSDEMRRQIRTALL